MNGTLLSIAELAGIAALVYGILKFFRTPAGDRIGQFLPAPFWVYFLPMLGSSVGLVPSSAPAYGWLTSYALPGAIFLMLVGAPVGELVRMGPRAGAAWALATVTMMIGSFAAFALLYRWLPPESWKAIGALLGTWIGGSANMLAVKEMVGMSDAQLAPLVIVDTLLSYSWLALLLAGVAYQSRFDRGAPEVALAQGPDAAAGRGAGRGGRLALAALAIVLGVLFARLGLGITAATKSLSASAWALLAASSLSVLFALTPASRLERWGASSVGSFLLYMVLVTIGAKADATAVRTAPIFLMLGAAMLLLHGVLLAIFGRLMKLPLFLLATASQADVGGPISAPIVALAYRPGSAHVGVLMAIAGAVTGTYLGFVGGLFCRFLEGVLRR